MCAFPGVNNFGAPERWADSLCSPFRFLQELADYLLDRARAPWMHDLMVLTQELQQEALEAFRSAPPEVIDLTRTCERESDRVPQLRAPSAGSFAAAGEAPLAISDEVFDALGFVTGVKDRAVLVNVASELPAAVLEEQVRSFRQRSSDLALAPKVTPFVVHPQNVSSRNQTAARFDAFLRSCGWRRGDTVPYGATRRFLSLVVFPGAKQKRKAQQVLRWHQTWSTCMVCDNTRNRAGALCKRRRRPGKQGRPAALPWLRQALYEWWSSMRYSVDWKAVAQGVAPQLRPKRLARFTRSVLKAKAQQLLADYLATALTAGSAARGVSLRPTWFANWQKEFGLSMRRPNRKYKVPKAVLMDRLETGWLNVARVRALCLEVHGYDPHMENWDQSPFHHNETGSQNAKTLAVVGAIVPLVEGHADTRARWTANLTTFSDTERLLREGPPYAEFVFKAGGDQLQLRLRQHLDSRGYGKWLSVATSEKGSYTLPDVLNFLETHLPMMPAVAGERQWRIIMADDHSPHLSPHVARLCWQRGYVFIPHGGGVTPVVQTVDTDLNQHVKREYQTAEAVEHLRQMRLVVMCRSCGRLIAWT